VGSFEPGRYARLIITSTWQQSRWRRSADYLPHRDGLCLTPYRPVIPGPRHAFLGERSGADRIAQSDLARRRMNQHQAYPQRISDLEHFRFRSLAELLEQTSHQPVRQHPF